ncbi:MAG: hypothetical protein R2854_29240 [Caldilineaceae bacterium]
MSYLEDRLAMMAEAPGDGRSVAALGAEVPQEIVNDYLHGQARNHEVNRAMIEVDCAGHLRLPDRAPGRHGGVRLEHRRTAASATAGPPVAHR